jgi:hypothetical protein
MGCFNTLKVTCPHCDKTIELQSKAGSCSMEYHVKGEDPNYELEFCGFHDCYKCHKFFVLENIVEPIIVVKKYEDDSKTT